MKSFQPSFLVSLGLHQVVLADHLLLTDSKFRVILGSAVENHMAHKFNRGQLNASDLSSLYNLSDLQSNFKSLDEWFL